MAVEIRIPQFGESVVEVTIGSILKPSGTIIQTDEELVELETDKLNQVLHAPCAGKIAWTVSTGDVVKVGSLIGTVDPAVIAQDAPQKIQESSQETKAPKENKKPEKIPPSQKGTESSLPLPKARKSADATLEEMGKAPALEKNVPQGKKAEGKETRKKMTQLRQTIAKKLVQVKNETAMLTTFNEIDMSAVIAVREKEQESFQKKYGVKLGFMSFFIKAAVAALQAFPEINGKIIRDEIVLHHFYDISVAVSTEKGLMVPVIRGAENLTYAQIEKQLQELAQKARSGTISVDDIQGGTFTITNAGLFGSLLSTPILNPPQSGILGMHNIVKRAVVVNDQIVIAPMMYVALSYDHRIVDGKQAVSFLMHMKKNLEEPARLLLDL